MSDFKDLAVGNVYGPHDRYIRYATIFGTISAHTSKKRLIKRYKDTEVRFATNTVDRKNTYTLYRVITGPTEIVKVLGGESLMEKLVKFYANS